MMDIIGLGLYGAGLLGALAGLLWACKTDFMTMTIPNRVTLVIGAAFVPAYLGAHLAGLPVFQGPVAHLAALVLMLGLTFVMFMLRVWGAGDSKLASAVALWIGLQGFMMFMLSMAIAGLVLIAVVYGIRKLPLHDRFPVGSWPARLYAGEKNLPYGIAIVAGAVAAMTVQGCFGVLL